MDKPDKSAAQELKEFLTNVFGRQAEVEESNSSSVDLAVPRVLLWAIDIAAAEKFVERFCEMLSRVSSRQFTFNIQTINLTKPIVNWNNILAKSNDYQARVIFVLADCVECPVNPGDILIRSFGIDKLEKKYFYIDLAVDFLEFIEKLNAQ